MSLSFTAALGGLDTALKLRTERASLLAGNLANADTPNYKARDFDFYQVLNNQLGNTTTSSSGIRTHAQHMQNVGTRVDGVSYGFRTPSQPGVDGNTVEEHIEHSEFMKNNLEFQTTFTLLNRKFMGLQKAIRGE